MKPGIISIIVVCVSLGLFAAASWWKTAPVVNLKDLNENMVDIRIYQENLGDYVRSGDLENGKWLLIGMDSILRVVADKFDEHRKLSKPFSYFYNQKLKTTISKLKKAFNTGDTALARRQYRIMVNKCNSCHIDNDIEKEARY
jgi:hypothetical protein